MFSGAFGERSTRAAAHHGGQQAVQLELGGAGAGGLGQLRLRRARALEPRLARKNKKKEEEKMPDSRHTHGGGRKVVR